MALTRETRVLPNRTRGVGGNLLFYPGFAEAALQILHNLLDQGRMLSCENEQILGAFSSLWKHDKVLSKKFRFPSYVEPVQINCARDGASTFSGNENALGVAADCELGGGAAWFVIGKSPSSFSSVTQKVSEYRKEHNGTDDDSRPIRRNVHKR